MEILPRFPCFHPHHGKINKMESEIGAAFLSYILCICWFSLVNSIPQPIEYM